MPYKETSHDHDVMYSGCYASLNKTQEGFSPVVNICDGGWQVDGSSEVVAAFCTLFKKTEKNETSTQQEVIPLEDINLNPLQLGAINLSKSVVCINSVKPQGLSKYRRLPHDGNIRVVDPFTKERQYLGIKPAKGIKDYFLLNAWGNSSYLPAVDALGLVTAYERLGAAFSPEYFFGLSKAGGGVFLFKSGLRIARVNNEGETLLKPPVHWLMEELSEFGLSIRRIEK